MTVCDRLRVRLHAGDPSGDFLYGSYLYGSFNYGEKTDELSPGGAPFTALVESMTMTTGRRRNLDFNAIGVCNLSVVQMDVPGSWLSDDPTTTPVAVVLGRLLVVEAFNDGAWSTVFTGTVETALLDTTGTGDFDQPVTRWQFTALDNLNRLRFIQEAPGVDFRPIEVMYQRVEAIAAKAGLTVNWVTLPTIGGSGIEVMETEYERDLLAEAESVTWTSYRMTASRDGGAINMDGLIFGQPELIGTTLFISSQFEMYPDTDFVYFRMLVPCATSAEQSWPMDRLLNDVVVTTADVPTDPTPDDYIHQDATSIGDYGRRSYQQTDVRTVEGPIDYIARDIGAKILETYAQPRPYVSAVRLDFTKTLDLDTVFDGTTHGTYEVGFAYAIANLRHASLFAFTLPRTDLEALAGGVGTVLGVEWRVTGNSRAECVVFLEAIAELVGELPPEPGS